MVKTKMNWSKLCVSKITIWTWPIHFVRDHFILAVTKSLWSSPNQFGLTKTILDRPKLFWSHRRTRQKSSQCLKRYWLQCEMYVGSVGAFHSRTTSRICQAVINRPDFLWYFFSFLNVNCKWVILLIKLSFEINIPH